MTGNLPVLLVLDNVYGNIYSDVSKFLNTTLKNYIQARH